VGAFNSRGVSTTGHVPCPARPRRSASPKLGSPGCKPGGLASKPQGMAATTLASLPSRKACQRTGANHGPTAKHGSHVRVGFLPTGAGLAGRTKAGAARFCRAPAWEASTWPSGAASAPHAGRPGFKFQWAHLFSFCRGVACQGNFEPNLHIAGLLRSRRGLLCIGCAIGIYNWPGALLAVSITSALIAQLARAFG
jgi:hypothetical protein